jgi:hypothetical protein
MRARWSISILTPEMDDFLFVGEMRAAPSYPQDFVVRELNHHYMHFY